MKQSNERTKKETTHSFEHPLQSQRLIFEILEDLFQVLGAGSTRIKIKVKHRIHNKSFFRSRASKNPLASAGRQVGNAKRSNRRHASEIDCLSLRENTREKKKKKNLLLLSKIVSFTLKISQTNPLTFKKNDKKKLKKKKKRKQKTQF